MAKIIREFRTEDLLHIIQKIENAVYAEATANSQDDMKHQKIAIKQQIEAYEELYKLFNVSGL